MRYFLVLAFLMLAAVLVAGCEEKKDKNIIETDSDALCGNGTLEQSEVCEQNDTKDCMEVDAALYTSGKAICKDDCSGWNTVTCTEIEQDAIVTDDDTAVAENDIANDATGTDNIATDDDPVVEDDEDTIITDTATDVDTVVGWTPYANLQWSDKSVEVFDWDEATAYCTGIGGRLPTIDELRKTIKDCEATEFGGACPVTDPSCLELATCGNEGICKCDGTAANYSWLWDEKDVYLWSSSCDSESVIYAWYVSYADASIKSTFKSTGNSIRCRCVK